jgi:hypothetical protein
MRRRSPSAVQIRDPTVGDDVSLDEVERIVI